MQQLVLRPSGDRVNLEVMETVRLPWNQSVIVAFEGYSERLKDVDMEDIQLRDYHLGLHGGYVSGLIKHVPPPSWMAISAAKLLENAVFKDLVFPEEAPGVRRRDPLWIHPAGWLPPHPNIWQIPEGSLGGGAVLVRDVTVLAYGKKRDLPTSQVEKKALLMQHTRDLLETLGYERVPD